MKKAFYFLLDRYVTNFAWIIIAYYWDDGNNYGVAQFSEVYLGVFEIIRVLSILRSKLKERAEVPI